MAKILFEINYNVKPDKRDEYLNVINELKGLIQNGSGSRYSVYENKKNSNNFSEIYFCESQEEYDNLEDNQDDKVTELTERLFSDFIEEGSTTYNTRFEL